MQGSLMDIDHDRSFHSHLFSLPIRSQRKSLTADSFQQRIEAHLQFFQFYSLLEVFSRQPKSSHRSAHHLKHYHKTKNKHKGVRHHL